MKEQIPGGCHLVLLGTISDQDIPNYPIQSEKHHILMQQQLKIGYQWDGRSLFPLLQDF